MPLRPGNCHHANFMFFITDEPRVMKTALLRRKAKFSPKFVDYIVLMDKKRTLCLEILDFLFC